MIYIFFCLVLFLSYVSSLLAFVICVSILCHFCNWLSDCWLGTLVKMNWTELLWQYRRVGMKRQTDKNVCKYMWKEIWDEWNCGVIWDQTCKFDLWLKYHCYHHHHHVFLYSYEPELFPGLIYRMVKPRVVLLIFVNGKVVMTGKTVLYH